MKKFFTSLLAFLLFISVCARTEDVPANDKKTAEKLVSALKAGDKAAVAKLIQYPLRRDSPLPSLKNEKEFVHHYEEFFDAGTIATVEQGIREIWFNWRGTAIGRGSIWISEGKIIAINVSTKLQSEHATNEKIKQDATLHSTVSKYERLNYECKTKKHHIRIHQVGEKQQYVSWKNGQSISQKPELVLDGVIEQQGSGGNLEYVFKNGDHSYRVEEIHLCGETCDGDLIVLKGEKEVSREVCDPINK